MIDVTAIGEILIDFTPIGSNEQGIPIFAQNPGGAPANVLAMISKLGGKSAFIGKVGQDSFGTALKKVLLDNQIDTSGLVFDKVIPTTLAFVHLDENGDRSFSFYRKPGADIMLTHAEIKRELIDRCGIFHFGSLSLTDEPCRSAVLEAVKYAKSKKKTISFDPNYRQLLWESEESAKSEILSALRYADILKVCEEEMTLLTEETSPEKGARLLAEYGPGIVFISRGEKGSVCLCGGVYAEAPAFDVRVTDTTGAGDAFYGAALYRLKGCDFKKLGKKELEDILLFSNAAGSLTTTNKGAIPAIPTLEEIIELSNYTGRK